MRRVWWAVWLEELPDEGSLHVKARNEKEALYKAKRNGMQLDDGGEPLEVVVRRVSSAMHREWLESEC